MNPTMPARQNKLALESSPYLLQHANNPVDWLAWNTDSLALARQTGKPILLSIGYSACHWCHVMAHESFEDQETADLMNRYFVNIKVDKEERPDLDKIYQNAHSMLTERPGGWPLTVFLTPDDHMPIFAGTYFPPRAAHGLPAFRQLLEHIHDVWTNRRDDISRQSQSIRKVYRQIADAAKPTGAALNSLVIDICRNQIEQQFDAAQGGFSQAPKFPHPSILQRAMEHAAGAARHQQPDPRILHCAMLTLYKMGSGGIYDHPGGGFFRYSTDAEWQIPHFEKMLYDNGPLLALYAQAWCISDDARFHNIALETADWVIREMQAPQGGYYAALDADTDGGEGQFYVWNEEEVAPWRQSDSWQAFVRRFGFDRPANFEGKWHLHGYVDEIALASQLEKPLTEVFDIIRQAKKKLFTLRSQRPAPHRDEKILTAWNGLMIHGMARCGRLLKQPQYVESALRAARFLKQQVWRPHSLNACHKDGRSYLAAYLDDYAFLMQGLIELLQCRWDDELYHWLLELADTLIEQFEDSESGGFFFTGHQHETLIQRIKSFSDDAIPAGNAIACQSLLLLGALSGRADYTHCVERALKSAWQAINQTPVSHCAMVSALAQYLQQPTILVIRSQPDDDAACQQLFHHHYLPNTACFSIPASQTPPGDLAAKSARQTTCAYVCTGQQCDTTLNSLDEIVEYIENNSYRISE